MKSLILALALVPGAAFAQDKTIIAPAAEPAKQEAMKPAEEPPAEKPARSEAVASKGLRVAGITSLLRGRLSFEDVDGEDTELTADTYDHVVGASIGYANIMADQVGYTVSIALMNLHLDSTDTALLRIDGNVAFGLNETVHLKAGLNGTKVVGGNGPFKDDWDPGIGGQAAIGVQFNPTLGLDLAFVAMRNTRDTTDALGNDTEMQIVWGGIEIGLTGTF